jgi:two-component system, cell cycle response regulator
MKVLIAEDDPINNRLLKTLLFRWGFDVVTADDGVQACRILDQEDGPQIAVLDWVMPELDGLEVCRRLREREKGGDRYTYVIMLTGRSDREDIITGIDAGADDYIVKPFDTKELNARLHTGQRIIDLQTALRAANKKLLFLSRLDPLTGALSRNAILDDLDLAMYRSKRERKSLGISLVDVDNLKGKNESYGRGAGDLLLQDCVRRINSCLRRTDGLGRLGGDEFLVILLGVDFTVGTIVCQRIKQAVSGQEVTFNNYSIPVTVSQSLAVWDGKAGIDELIVSAQQTLAATKDRGANRVEKVPSIGTTMNPAA